MDDIRKWCAGPHQLNLAPDYLQFMSDVQKTFSFTCPRQPLDNKDFVLVKAPAVKSRMKGSTGRTICLLFSKKEKLLVDSLCTCENGPRSIPCAHRGAVLVALHNLKFHIPLPPIPTKSVRARSKLNMPTPFDDMAVDDGEPTNFDFEI